MLFSRSNAIIDGQSRQRFPCRICGIAKRGAEIVTPAPLLTCRGRLVRLARAGLGAARRGNRGVPVGRAGCRDVLEFGDPHFLRGKFMQVVPGAGRGAHSSRGRFSRLCANGTTPTRIHFTGRGGRARSRAGHPARFPRAHVGGGAGANGHLLATNVYPMAFVLAQIRAACRLQLDWVAVFWDQEEIGLFFDQTAFERLSEEAWWWLLGWWSFVWSSNWADYSTVPIHRFEPWQTRRTAQTTAPSR